MKNPCNRQQPKVEVDMDWWKKEQQKLARKVTYVDGPVDKKVNGKTKRQR